MSSPNVETLYERALVLIALGALILSMASSMSARAGSSELEPGGGAVNPDFPPVLEGDLGSLVPQSQADLERTRAVLYGQALTPDQHAIIETWRPDDIDWWLSRSRNAESRAMLLGLEELVQGRPARHGRSAVESDDRSL